MRVSSSAMLALSAKRATSWARAGGIQLHAVQKLRKALGKLVAVVAHHQRLALGDQFALLQE